MIFMIRSIFFAMVLLSVTCKHRTESFYMGYIEGDLYRVPLIYPYQITQLYGLEKGKGLTNSWALNFHYEGDSTTPGFSNGVMVSEINVSNGIIYGYDYEQPDYPGVWFVIVPDQRVEKVFKNNKKQWNEFLSQYNISNPELYQVWEIFEEFKNSSKLPWYTPD